MSKASEANLRRTCEDGPHRFTGDPCGCPATNYTCCLECPLKSCILDTGGLMSGTTSSLRAQQIQTLLEQKVPKFEILTRLRIDHTQYQRAVEKLHASPRQS